MWRNSKFPADQVGLVTGQENHNTRLLAVMEIKAFPNGASAGHRELCQRADQDRPRQGFRGE